MTRCFTPLILVSSLTLAGCAGTVLRPNDTASQEAQELRARIVELQRQAAMNEVELARLRQQVAELEARAGGRPSAPPPRTTTGTTTGTTTARPSPAPPTATTPARPAPAPETRREPARTAPAPAPAPAQPSAPVRREPAPAPADDEIEEVDIELPDPQPRQPARTPTPAPTTRPAAPAQPSPAPPATAPSTPPATPPAPAGEEEPESLSPAAQVLYDRGYTLYHQGHFVDAEASFQRFLQANPGSELADNAQYWIGECRYARSDLRGALAAFRETVERHPKGNKVPDAMLKAGQSLEGLGDI
ncbi:MAG TPA: tetratricopeptide repeat protein [Thermoanaerobaculia bacterium]|nr:tetratricopeptide repeat protein [Thermoanaerobaculia bacterium]